MLNLSPEAPMSDQSNDPNAVLAQHDSSLVRENADLRARLAAYEESRVARPAFAGEAPRYYLNGACFLGDGMEQTHYVTGTTLEYWGEPNMDMAPLNEPARRATDTMIARLTEAGQRAAAFNNREFRGLVTDRNILIDQAMIDAKMKAAAAAVPVILAPVAHAEPPAMPHMPEAQAQARRRNVHSGLVGAVQAPAPPKPDLGAGMAPPAPAPERGAVVGRMGA
jgi:hypothetical protein